MKIAPIINASSFHHLFPGRENSSTISSEHDTYMKLPPDRLVKIIFTNIDASFSKMPIRVPKGVAKENSKINLKSFLNSKLLFYMAMLMDIDSANL